jgi:hypothetical protein
MKIVSDPQRNYTVYNLWDNGERVAQNIPSKELATVFAAAPDLLEALEAAESLINRHVVAMDAGPVLKIVHAVIAKARGQS